MSSKTSSSLPSTPTWLAVAYGLIGAGLLQVVYMACQEAYDIRLYAVKEFGRIIHEFDPYFNYRATVYLYDHGWKAFSQWFDYMVWYPLGRPVGTTIYPGMQVTSVFIKNHILKDWSVNDICVFVPAWFGVTATLAVGWLTLECSREQGTFLTDLPFVQQVHKYLLVPVIQFFLRLLEKVVPSATAWGVRPGRSTQSPIAPYLCATAAAGIMSIVPAHLLRSVAGGYDNESIAMTAMVTTFACWTCSLRTVWNNLWITTLLGVLTGLAYFYMVAAWGGYVFVINLIAAHAGLLVLLGRYSTKLHRSYTAFYIVGTILAIQVPVVGWTPLKSLEQMGPLLAFGGLQLIEVVEVQKRAKGWGLKQTWKARIIVFGSAAAVGALIAAGLAYIGYFGPISSRVRGLFVQHTKTGNPLVDSVAEHQKASPEAYFQYLHHVCTLIPVGAAWVLLRGFGDSSSFLLVYGLAAYYFSLRMVRLILLTAPIASVLGGICIGRLVSYFLVNPLLLWDDTNTDTVVDAKKGIKNNSSHKSSSPKKSKKSESTKAESEPKQEPPKEPNVLFKWILPLTLRAIRVGVIWYFYTKEVEPKAKEFYRRSHDVAQSISHPTIVNKARTRDGQDIIVDDYREAYMWLDDNTPEDSRIMAWWDYGYQITGIGNRTTIADGNTWNHEHIALLGRTLTAPEKEAHRIARHLADYVLVWAGGGGDDLAKSPHLRRIANSVYRGLCAEPTCRDFGFYQDRSPTDSMRGSLLYTLHSNGLVPGVVADRNRFREVYKSKYGKVRIYKVQAVSKESKEWVEKNRKCDAPGSWFCPGQYPPALIPILQQKRDFAQLEDFNRGQSDEDYTRQYFENLHKSHGDELGEPKKKSTDGKTKLKKVSAEIIAKINEHWENNEMTTALWQTISANKFSELRDILAEDPNAAHLRSEDGRGPMWWAHENGHTKIIELLKRLGVSEELRDANGISPLDISKKS